MKCKHKKREYLNMELIEGPKGELIIGWNCYSCNHSGIDILELRESLELDDELFDTRSPLERSGYARRSDVKDYMPTSLTTTTTCQHNKNRIGNLCSDCMSIVYDNRTLI